MGNPADANTSGRDRWTWIAVAGIATVAAVLVGAYVDWIWWPVYQGFVLTLVAGVVLIVGGFLAAFGRGVLRRVGLLAFAVAVGLLIGQNVGPSREPLIHTEGGTMTLRLTSPTIAEGTAPVSCANVPSATEFQVNGNPIVDLGDRLVDGVYVDVGDRWEALGNGSRRDGVRLDISVTDRKIPDAGAPTMLVMAASDGSTVESTFSPQGGSIRFAGLVPRAVDGVVSGVPVDLAGTVDWSCGTVTTE